MKDVMIEHLTWMDVEDLVASGIRRVVICASSTEQHGPHLPLATDELLGAEYARRLALKLGDALVAPVIRPGCSDHHMSFPGSMTVPAPLLLDLFDRYVDSLERHGFERFIILTSHGGNYPVLTEWNRTRSRSNCVVLEERGYVQAGFEALRRFGRADSAGPHADLLETSMMLVIRPELVHMSKAAPGFEDEEALEVLLASDLRDITPNGILGNPVGATAEIGEAALETIASAMAEGVAKIEQTSNG
jgi:creatinine amidohydrolase